MSPNEEAAKLVAMGRAAIEAREFEKAEACFDRAVSADVECVDAWLGLARCQRERDAYSEAERSCRHALALDGMSVAAWVELSEALGNLQMWDETGAACERALALDPECAKALANLSVVRETQSKLDEASELIDRSLLLDPTDPEAWAVRASQRYRAADLDGALGDAEQSTQADESYGPGWSLSLSVLHCCGDKEKATAVCREALGHVANDRYRLVFEGYIATREGRFFDAATAYKRAVERNPNEPFFWHALGTLYYNLDKREEAIETLKEAVRLDPADADAHFMLGYLHLYRQDSDSARRHLKILRKLGSSRADELKRMLLPWDRQRIHGYGWTALGAWAITGGVITGPGAPLMAHSLYQAAGAAMFAGYAALVLRINRQIRDSRSNQESPPPESPEIDPIPPAE